MKPLFVSSIAILALTVSFAGVGSRSKSSNWHVSHFENVLGTSMEIKLVAASDVAADRAENAALHEIKRLNGILSGYDPTSEFSRWSVSRGQAVPVSPELMEVLKLWDAWHTRSGGALNPAAEAIGRVWKQAETAGRRPAAADLHIAADAAAQPQWALDEQAGTATRLTGTPLMLNSFTKSYVIEHAAAAALRSPGITGVVLNIGGDLVVRGAESQRVDIADPRADAENAEPIASLQIGDRAAATSGNYRRGYDIGGRRYSHIVDPRTGRTADDIVSATVVAPKAVDAGALATALCVLSPAESRTLAAKVSGAEYMLETREGVRIFSAGWKALETQRPLLVAAAVPQARSLAPAAAAGSWNPDFALTISVELPQRQGFGARRPYVALWIEDKDRYPVRMLAVLYEQPRYLNELRAWYRDESLRSMSEGSNILRSVSSATRSPGKYSFQWDGKDNAGRLVKAGHYTVMVEAAREHGGYTLDKHEMDFNGEPAQAELPKDAELGVVTLDYHKVAH